MCGCTCWSALTFICLLNPLYDTLLFVSDMEWKEQKKSAAEFFSLASRVDRRFLWYNYKYFVILCMRKLVLVWISTLNHIVVGMPLKCDIVLYQLRSLPHVPRPHTVFMKHWSRISDSVHWWLYSTECYHMMTMHNPRIWNLVLQPNVVHQIMFAVCRE